MDRIKKMAQKIYLSDQLTHSSRNYLALGGVNYAEERNNERQIDRRSEKDKKKGKRVLIKRR